MVRNPEAYWPSRNFRALRLWIGSSGIPEAVFAFAFGDGWDECSGTFPEGVDGSPFRFAQAVFEF